MTTTTDARTILGRSRQGAPVTLPTRSTIVEEIAQLQELLATRRLVAVASLAHERYQLRMPLLVDVVSANGRVVATSDEYSVYAEAPTESECIREFRALFVEDYEFLCENAEDLGTELAERLRAYRDLIQERSA